MRASDPNSAALTRPARHEPDSPATPGSAPGAATQAGRAPADTGGDITQLLQDWQAGNPGACEQLVQRLHHDFLRMAASRLSGYDDLSLSRGDMLHESILRLMKASTTWQNRAHFFANVSLTMRSVLREHARARLADKRGGQPVDITLSAVESGVRRQKLPSSLEALARIRPARGAQCQPRAKASVSYTFAERAPAATFSSEPTQVMINTSSRPTPPMPMSGLRMLPLALAASMLAGCATVGQRGTADPAAAAAAGYQQVPMHADALRLADAIPKDRSTTAARQLAAEGIRAMDVRDYAKANDLFNLALKVDINNSQLHLLNSVAYHLRALGGEGSLYGLAQQGYERAIEFDPSNTFARHQLGLLFMDRRDHASAVQHLMEATLYTRNDPDLLYDLAVASYYAKDARNAFAALEGLRGLEQQGIRPRTLRASAIVAAAAGDDAGAQAFVKQYRASGARADAVSFTEQRVNSWRDSFGSGMMKAQFTQPPGQPQTQQPYQPPYQQPYQQPYQPPYQQPFQQQPGSSPFPQQVPGSLLRPSGMPGSFGASGQSGGFFDKRMVMLDVAIVSTEEDNNDTFGVNLLDGLRLQFGNTQGTPAVSRLTSVNSDLVSAVTTSSTRAVTRLISLPALTYALNIANAQDRRNEVVARPSLVALGGQTSTFFSGTDVIGAAISTGQGGSVQVQKEAGVKLAVTPEFLPDDLIKLQVVAERTFLTNPNSNVLFDFRLDTSKTLVAANVVMKYGETLILSGLSERNLESSNSGVPVLRDVPLVQYLFNRQTKRDFHKSVLIVVTPRRPSYTNRSNEDIEAEKANLSAFEKVQQEFEAKYRLWFKPVPNTAAAMKVLDTSPIFREFRTGDLEMESWTSRSTHAGRLKAALGFLYY